MQNNAQGLASLPTYFTYILHMILEFSNPICKYIWVQSEEVLVELG